MLISTKGRYALRVMIDLAEHQTDGYIPVSYTHLDVYKRQVYKSRGKNRTDGGDEE